MHCPYGKDLNCSSWLVQFFLIDTLAGNMLVQLFIADVLQIQAIRSEISIIHKKNVDLTDVEAKLVNRLRWGIVVLQSKNENTIRRQVLQWWR